jgi:hypothetical protein
MQKFLSLAAALSLMSAVPGIALASHDDQDASQSAESSSSVMMRKLMRKNLRKAKSTLQGNILDNSQDRVTDKHPKDRDTLKSQMDGRWHGITSRISKPLLRNKLSGDTLRCVQVAEKSGKVDARCARLTDWQTLMSNCAKDMDYSGHCMNVEHQVIDWANAQAAASASSSSSSSAESSSSSSAGSVD